MPYKLIIRPMARVDLLDSFNWYQLQREGLGFEFKMCIDEVFSIIQKNPLTYSKVYKNIRRSVIKRFPFAVFYLVEGETIVVLAVLHARRNPEIWKDRA